MTSDIEPQFRRFKNFLTDNIIVHRAVMPLHSANNGEEECQNKSLVKRNRIVHTDNKGWKREEITYLFSHRTTLLNTTTRAYVQSDI